MAKKIDSETSLSWQIEHFKKVVTYIDDSRTILAMVCIEKDNISLEKYEHYGFLVDVIDHALKTGQILLKSSDEDLKTIGGQKEIKRILETLQTLRNKDLRANDESLTLGHWDNLTAEQLAAEIEKVADKTESPETQPSKKKKGSKKDV